MKMNYYIGKAGVNTDDAFAVSAFAGELPAAGHGYFYAADENKSLSFHRYYAEACARSYRADRCSRRDCDYGAEMERRILNTRDIIELANLLRNYGMQRYLDRAIEDRMRLMAAHE